MENNIKLYAELAGLLEKFSRFIAGSTLLVGDNDNITLEDATANIVSIVDSLNYIDFDQYMQDCARTFNSKDTDTDYIHCAAGMSTEANEILDNAKKLLAYGKQPDDVNTQEEIGDLMFYVAMMCLKRGYSMKNILATNIAKLKARYPVSEGFTTKSALNRNLDKEKEILDDGLARNKE